MFTTISIQKKFIYFFLISIIISAILTSSINSFIAKNEKIVDPCRIKIKLKLNYNSILDTDSDNVTIIHSYLKSIIRTQLNSNFPKMIENDEAYFDGNNIIFRGDNCIENSNKIYSEFKNIKNTTFKQFDYLKNYLKANEINVPLKDELIFMATTPENIIDEIKISKSEEKINILLLKVIQFFIILMCLNLGYFFISRVRIKFY